MHERAARYTRGHDDVVGRLPDPRHSRPPLTAAAWALAVLLLAVPPGGERGPARAATAERAMPAERAPANATRTRDDRGFARRADLAVRAFVARHGIPSAHVTLVRGDRVILQRGYVASGAHARAPDAASMFPLGSISKQFTAAAIFALADAGRLRLDAPVGEYLPEWFAGEPDLRVSHLLMQTSGLADFLWLDGYRELAADAGTPLAAYVARGAAAPRRFPPGTRWAYSNTNYKALALIAERMDGRPFDDVLVEHVLRPRGIDGVVACHRLGADGFVPGVAQDGTPRPLDVSAAAYAGDGGLCGNAAALTQWLRRVLASRDAADTRLSRPTRLADGTLVPYGAGVSTREFLDRAMIWHGGNVDSHSTLLAYLPDEDLGVVILTSKGFLWPTELLPALLDAKAPTGAPPGNGPLAPLPGVFEDGLFRYEVAPGTDSIRVTIDLIGPLEFVPTADHEWIARELPATFRLRLPADGSRDRFEMDWSELRSYARRVAPPGE